MIGGGGAPTGKPDPAPALNAKLPLYWYVGSKDNGEDPRSTFNALNAANNGAHWYRSRGYDNVQEYVMDGDDHFSIPQAKILDDVLNNQK